MGSYLSVHAFHSKAVPHKNYEQHCGNVQEEHNLITNDSSNIEKHFSMKNLMGHSTLSVGSEESYQDEIVSTCLKEDTESYIDSLVNQVKREKSNQKITRPSSTFLKDNEGNKLFASKKYSSSFQVNDNRGDGKSIKTDLNKKVVHLNDHPEFNKRRNSVAVSLEHKKEYEDEFKENEMYDNTKSNLPSVKRYKSTILSKNTLPSPTHLEEDSPVNNPLIIVCTTEQRPPLMRDQSLYDNKRLNGVLSKQKSAKIEIKKKKKLEEEKKLSRKIDIFGLFKSKEVKTDPNITDRQKVKLGDTKKYKSNGDLDWIISSLKDI
ncbi:hypothetical protein ABK040_010818 [Willaertia magna]